MTVGFPEQVSVPIQHQSNIGNFEKFTIEDNGEGSNFTALIKTYSGTYLSVDLGEGQGITTVSNANEAISWQFQVFSLCGMPGRAKSLDHAGKASRQ